MSVKNWLTSRNEKLMFITPDGVRHNLHDPAGRAVIRTTGWGMAPVEVADARGPYQHGTNPLNVRLAPRTIKVEVRYNGCNRDEYWALRSRLLDIVRPNRTNLDNPTPGNLRWYRSDGTIRQADVIIEDGPNYDPARDTWDEFSFQDTMTFTAFNPVLYDPNINDDVFTDLGCTLIQELQFPFTFGPGDIIFGASICNAVNTISVPYVGTWQEFPLITVLGPADNFKITHTYTGLYIELTNYSIPAGESVIFDLRYGRKTVSLYSTGESLLGFISAGSNLGAFSIEPDPIVPNGVNDFSVSIDGGTGDTVVNFQYYTRFVGI